MTAVRIPATLVQEMQAHARATYPDECCGFLLAHDPPAAAPAPRTIDSVVPAANEYDGERRRRFVIRPGELREMERRATEEGRSVVGFYHSHPDHPARPSTFDQEHAWPWYTYIVVSVTAREVPAWGAFELDPETALFAAVPMETTSAPLAADARVSES